MRRVSYQFERPKGFTLVELLVVIGIIGLLMSVLLPSLGRTRRQASAVVCTNNLKQLGLAFICYAGDYDDYAMPARVRQTNTYTYWWGQKLADGIDHRRGFVWPYLQSELKRNSVYECPAQRFGSYGLQAKPLGEPDDPKWITSTYGYNGYYLSPPQSGWENDIGNRPWQKITTVKSPDEVFAFADTLIEYYLLGSGLPLNTFLLDPPYKYEPKNMGNPWQRNEFPTTCFRHNDRANVVFADGHYESMDLEGSQYTSSKAKVGSVGKINAPHYVPDYLEWTRNSRKRIR